MNTYQQTIESLLFYENQPVSFAWLSRHLGISIVNTKEEVEGLMKYYENRGIEILVHDDMVSLVTHRSQQKKLLELEEQEQVKELSKQALETLAIIVYKQGITKAEIDFIRGVNSVYILRNLTIRGLIEKKQNADDKRSPKYRPTLDLLSYLGIAQVSELPEYEMHTKKLEALQEDFLQEQLTLSEE